MGKVVRLCIFQFVVVFLFHDNVLAQCNFLRPQIDISFNTDQDCAPVTVTNYTVTYYFNAPQNPADIQIFFEWNDPLVSQSAIDSGSGMVVGATAAGPNTSFQATANFTYNDNNGKCTITPTASVYIGGIQCLTSMKTQTAFFWGRDDQANGQLMIDPVNYEVCYNNPILNVVFTDQTEFNCHIGVEPDNPNRLARAVQFVYGTNHNAGSAIKNLTLNDGGVVNITNGTGALASSLTRGSGALLVTGAYFGPVETVPFPADGPMSQSFPLSAPANALNQIGDRFELTMYNWNACNPWNGDSANPNYEDAISTPSYVVIVGAPVPDYQTRLNNAAGVLSTNICLGQSFYFENLTAGAGGLSYSWEFYDDDAGVSLLATSAVVSPTYNFTSGGDKLVRLYAEDVNTQGACVEMFESVLSISPNLVAKIELYDPVSNSQISGNFCEDGLSHEIEFRDVSAGTATGNTRWRWEFYDENNTLVLEEPVGGGFSNVASGPYVRSFLNPGNYKASLAIRDVATGCESYDQKQVVIAPEPVANFTSTRACAGNPIVLEDFSFSPDGTSISTWELDYDYNAGIGFIADETLKKFRKPYEVIFNTPDTLLIAMRITTKGTQCTKMIVQEVIVDPLPIVAFDQDITEGCTDLDVQFYNTSPKVQALPLSTYTWQYDDGSGWVDFLTQSVASASCSDTVTYTFTNNTDFPLNYIIRLIGENEQGCQMISVESLLTVQPAPETGFDVLNYDPLANNCAPLDVDFKVNAATQLFNADTYRWRIYFKDSLISEQNVTGINPDFTYRFLNDQSISIKYSIELDVIKGSVCFKPFSAGIRVNPVPSSVFDVVLKEETCLATSYQFKAQEMGGQYQWKVGSRVYTNEQVEQLFIRPQAGLADSLVSISLITTNLAGCTSTVTSEDILIPAQDNYTFDLKLMNATANRCGSFNAAFINSSAGLSKDVIYSLLVSRDGEPEQEVTEVNGNIALGFQYPFDIAGSYSVRLKANIPSDCKMPHSPYVYFDVNPNVIADFSLSVEDGCAPIDLMVESLVPLSAGLSHSWEYKEKSETNFSQFSKEANALLRLFNQTMDTLIYEIKYKVTNAYNCKDELIKEVKILPGITPDFLLNTSVACAPLEIQATNLILKEGTAYVWNWGDGSIIDTTSFLIPSLSHIYSLGESITKKVFMVSLTVLDSLSGCVNITQQTVEVFPSVGVDIDVMDTVFCAPEQVIFGQQSFGITSGTWTITNESTGVEVYRSEAAGDLLYDFDNTSDLVNTYLVSFEGENEFGCSAIDTQVISVYPELAVDFFVNPTSVACAPHEIQVTNLTLKEGTAYVWNWGDGSIIDTTSFLIPSLSHTYSLGESTTKKVFMLNLTVVDSLSGCINATQHAVEVFPSVKVDIVADDSVFCAPKQVTFGLQSTGITSGTWTITDERDGAEVYKSSTSGELLFDFENNSELVKNYIVSFEGENNYGCSDVDSLVITVYPELEIDFSLNPIVQTLPNATISLKNLSPLGPWKYYWDFGDEKGTSELINPKDYTYEQAGVYDVRLTLSNAYCEVSKTTQVEIIPTLPQVDFISDVIEGCAPFRVQFTNLTKFADPSTYQWVFGDSLGLSESINPIFTFYEPGQYTVSLSAINSQGEKSAEEKELMITVHEKPVSDFNLRPNVVFLPDNPVYFKNRSINGVDYEWDFGDGNTSSEFEPEYVYGDTGVYDISLVVISDFGCADTLTRESVVTAEWGEKILIPNAFTPNLSGPSSGYAGSGGMVNDVFIPLIEGAKEFHMLVFNRWGELMFESKERYYGWDGYYKGKLAPQGVYIYKLSLVFENGKRQTKVGDINLIR